MLPIGSQIGLCVLWLLVPYVWSVLQKNSSAKGKRGFFEERIWRGWWNKCKATLWITCDAARLSQSCREHQCWGYQSAVSTHWENISILVTECEIDTAISLRLVLLKKWKKRIRRISWDSKCLMLCMLYNWTGVLWRIPRECLHWCKQEGVFISWITRLSVMHYSLSQILWSKNEVLPWVLYPHD